MSFPDLNPDFTEENFRRLVDAVNTLSRTITLENNLDGQIISDIDIPAATEIRVSHALKDVPKYKIILRHNNSNINITDGVEVWNDRYITIKNHGVDPAIISLIIMRR